MTADWMRDGLCQVNAYKPLYADRRPANLTRKKQTADAKATCRRCPVIGTCLEWALEQEGTRAASHRTGVLGGLTGAERAERAGAGGAQ